MVRELKVSMDRVRLWRRRWWLLQSISLDDLSIEERLEDLPRPGTPARITPDQRCQMEQMACQAPEQSGRPISQWTGRQRADEMVARGSVASISPRHAARLLKKGGFQPHLIRTPTRRSPTSITCTRLHKCGLNEDKPW